MDEKNTRNRKTNEQLLRLAAKISERVSERDFSDETRAEACRIFMELSGVVLKTKKKNLSLLDSVRSVVALGLLAAIANGVSPESERGRAFSLSKRVPGATR